MLHTFLHSFTWAKPFCTFLRTRVFPNKVVRHTRKMFRMIKNDRSADQAGLYLMLLKGMPDWVAAEGLTLDDVGISEKEHAELILHFEQLITEEAPN